MKTTNILFIATALFLTDVAHAQEFKIARTTGRLEIQIGRVTVEGYDGNEIIFSSAESSKGKDARADGLRAIGNLGLEDNTGLGVNVTEKGSVVEVRQLAKHSSPHIRIRVPKGVIVSYSYESQYGGPVEFRDMPNEIEVAAQYNNVRLRNVTGPLAVKTIYGAVEASFGSVINDPVSIVSVYGFVDVAMPQSTKATLKLSSSYGEIYVAPEFNIKLGQSEGMIQLTDRVQGTINGGGVNMDLAANYGKIYLRKL